MPSYKITIIRKIGAPLTGIRWYPSHDLEHIKFQVTQQTLKAIGRVNLIDIIIEMIDKDWRKE
jgi:hypothetical protein